MRLVKSGITSNQIQFSEGGQSQSEMTDAKRQSAAPTCLPIKFHPHSDNAKRRGSFYVISYRRKKQISKIFISCISALFKLYSNNVSPVRHIAHSSFHYILRAKFFISSRSKLLSHTKWDLPREALQSVLLAHKEYLRRARAFHCYRLPQSVSKLRKQNDFH